MRSVLLISLACVLGACAAPRLITSMTSSGDQMKLVYSRIGTAETGIILCDVAEDGSLVGCKKLPTVFKDGKGGT